MSTDSTELTFVRCPSCRSLVPASQSRCRMCGASLDASGKDEEAEKAKASRIKQKTMSQSKSEVAAALGQIREETGVVTPAPQPPAAPVSASAPVDDPLSAYLEEVDDEGLGAVAEDDFDDDDDWDAEPEAPLKANNGYQTVAPPPPPVEIEEPKFEAPKPAPEAKAKVFAESGKRSGGGGLSFSKPKESKPEPRRESRSDWKPVEKAPVPAPEMESHDYQERPRAQASAPRMSPSKAAMAGAQGRLFGWLVSYKNSEGSAIELREGKFFVTSNSLKPNDLLIDDGSVSTPHALINISVEGGFMVQDLMSERGVHVRHRDEDSYQKEDSTQLTHGDWVRFGDAEFLVSLVAHVGQKQ